MATPDVLVLGGADAGKTHYAGQLLGRFRHDRQGRLRLRPGGVEDLSKLEEVLSCLEEGRAAGHTPAETWTGIRCELVTREGREILVEWPEYAGERLFSLVEQRIIPSEWRASVTAAGNWMLFIRPRTLRVFEDLLVRPTGIAPAHTPSPGGSADATRWDDRARYVELLQMLLFAAGQTTFRRVHNPRIAVLLSCWDELETPKTPKETFAAELPLLDAFLRSTWDDASWSVWGLSSLGRALSQTNRDPAFAAAGPEHFGYVVHPDATAPDNDLTAPVAWLLKV